MPSDAPAVAGEGGGAVAQPARGRSMREIAADLAAYLRAHPSVCADVSVHAGNHPWVRYVEPEAATGTDADGDAADRDDDEPGGEYRLARFADYGRVEGRVLDESDVVDLFASNPVRLQPVSEAYRLRGESGTVWEHAAEQDVFTAHDRCEWCGYSDRTRSLAVYETVADGDCRLCNECAAEWERAGELATPEPVDASASGEEVVSDA